eukprot:TRINITY_DN56261_c0_g2_i1.p1 TRINITY_DN56261_c0_g2~~TRINITY_DN56261_c0_g2_i1.p1  ORF type:complete len:436 (+),score=107.86 TRINITY_DN56261_c0_g2_i1:58-1365(+)
MLLSKQEQRMLYGSWSPDAPPSQHHHGFLLQLIHLLLSLPRDSIYSFWLAACVHKWVQASTPREQHFVATIPGWMEYVTNQIIQSDDQCFTIRQVYFDLLGEMIKYNPTTLRLLEVILDHSSLHQPFKEMIQAHIMDASIFLQCVCLTREKHRNGGNFLQARFVLNHGKNKAEAAQGAPAEDSVSAGRTVEESRGPELVCYQGTGSSSSLGARMEPLHSREGHAELYGAMTVSELKTVMAQQGVTVQEPAEKADIVEALVEATWSRGSFELMLDQGESESTGVWDLMEESECTTRKLACAVQAADINVDAMCVVNAAIVFFVIAARHGHLAEYLIKVLEADSCEGADDKPAPEQLSMSLRKLLSSWRELYQGHACEREFLEFSSAIPFTEWEATVQSLMEELDSVMEKVTAAAGEQSPSRVCETPEQCTPAAAEV